MDEKGLLSEIFKTRYFGTTRCSVSYKLIKLRNLNSICDKCDTDVTLTNQNIALLLLDNAIWYINFRMAATLKNILPYNNTVCLN